MIRQLAILFGCLALGELIIWLTGIPLPSSILGMLILTLLLKLKIIRLEWVKTISDFLVANIGFFFVPPGVAIMLYFDIILADSNLNGHIHGNCTGRNGMGSSDLWKSRKQERRRPMSYLSNEFFLIALTFGSYFFGKLLHGFLSAGLIWILSGLLGWNRSVSAILAGQVTTIARLSFRRALTVSLSTTLLLGLIFTAVSLLVYAKGAFHRRGNRI